MTIPREQKNIIHDLSPFCLETQDPQTAARFLKAFRKSYKYDPYIENLSINPAHYNNFNVESAASLAAKSLDHTSRAFRIQAALLLNKVGRTEADYETLLEALKGKAKSLQQENAFPFDVTQKIYDVVGKGLPQFSAKNVYDTLSKIILFTLISNTKRIIHTPLTPQEEERALRLFRVGFKVYQLTLGQKKKPSPFGSKNQLHVESADEFTIFSHLEKIRDLTKKLQEIPQPSKALQSVSILFNDHVQMTRLRLYSHASEVTYLSIPDNYPQFLCALLKDLNEDDRIIGSNNGLSSFFNRIEHVIDLCKNDSPYKIGYASAPLIVQIAKLAHHNNFSDDTNKVFIKFLKNVTALEPKITKIIDLAAYDADGGDLDLFNGKIRGFVSLGTPNQNGLAPEDIKVCLNILAAFEHTEDLVPHRPATHTPLRIEEGSSFVPDDALVLLEKDPYPILPLSGKTLCNLSADDMKKNSDLNEVIGATPKDGQTAIEAMALLFRTTNRHGRLACDAAEKALLHLADTFGNDLPSEKTTKMLRDVFQSHPLEKNDYRLPILEKIGETKTIFAPFANQILEELSFTPTKPQDFSVTLKQMTAKLEGGPL